MSSHDRASATATVGDDTGGRLTQAERSALSEQKLLDAAVDLIAEQGYSRTTLAQIGKRAGYSRGLAGHRFGSKDRLLQVLVRHVGERFRAELLEPVLGERRGLDAILLLCSTLLRGLREQGTVARAYYVLLAESLGPAAEIRDAVVVANRELRAFFQEALRQGITRGEITTEIDPARGAAILAGTMRGLALQWLIDETAFDLDEVDRDLNELVERTLGKRAGRPVS